MATKRKSGRGRDLALESEWESSCRVRPTKGIFIRPSPEEEAILQSRAKPGETLGKAARRILFSKKVSE